MEPENHIFGKDMLGVYIVYIDLYFKKNWHQEHLHPVSELVWQKKPQLSLPFNARHLGFENARQLGSWRCVACHWGCENGPGWRRMDFLLNMGDIPARYVVG